MAAVPNPFMLSPHSFPGDESTLPSTAGDTWRSTPQSIPSTSMPPTKPSCKQASPKTLPTSSKSTSPQTPSRRGPQCTHMIMDRRYGKHKCHVCGKKPGLGFLYTCQQDYIDSNRSLPPVMGVASRLPGHGSVFDRLAKLAEILEMSTSVVNQIRAEEYSVDQIHLLCAQRLFVIETIRKAEARTDASDTPPDSPLVPSPADFLSVQPVLHQVQSSALVMPPAGTPYGTPVSGSPTNSNKNPPKKPKCNLQVCHACRPLFQDRVPMSLTGVLKDELPPLTWAEMRRLPVLDANVLANIHLREATNGSFASYYDGDLASSEGDDHFAEDWTPTAFDLHAPWYEDESDEEDTEEEEYPCPGPGRCRVWVPLMGCAYDLGHTDDQRAINHGFADSNESEEEGQSKQQRAAPTPPPHRYSPSSNASSISLLEPPTPSMLDSMTSFPKAYTVCGIMSTLPDWSYENIGTDSNSSLGSEVEVEGGVALTEEAVEAGLPDLVTDEE
ncbi:hypothetical protein BDY17DRAFT_70622 [Neohortaea acidophila]|uniref:Uncharacterized protein n=1 Tax=Neohortaea acidophila TaxID=245834 RepID=A0A6A6Q267_9PEZI|nr:uncharacterized protein BDY17DRAFT_70622 [Neohortaea acidophila]KAF2486079.1 hypothetical protein BDY17DRAFT_70622 [Neohortaea acidophila]